MTAPASGCRAVEGPIYRRRLGVERGSTPLSWPGWSGPSSFRPKRLARRQTTYVGRGGVRSAKSFSNAKNIDGPRAPRTKIQAVRSRLQPAFERGGLL